MIYGLDLAYVPHAGFSEYARHTAPAVARLLAAGRPFSRQARRRLPVIEFGSGGGTTARYLSRRGFEVVGFDPSPAMVRLARRTAPLARFAVGSLARTPLPRCGAIIALGEVVNYLGDRRSIPAHDRGLFRFFARAARALEPGGLLLFDVMESARHRTFDASTRSGDDWAVVASARAEGALLTRHIATVRYVGGKGARRSCCRSPSARSPCCCRAIGIYGVLAYVVTQRRREIGIRLALGSSGRRIFDLILREGLILIAAGFALGAVGAIALRRSLQSQLFEISATDPLALTAAAAGLALVAVAACALPARCATRIDPVIALAE